MKFKLIIAFVDVEQTDAALETAQCAPPGSREWKVYRPPPEDVPGTTNH